MFPEVSWFGVYSNCRPGVTWPSSTVQEETANSVHCTMRGDVLVAVVVREGNMQGLYRFTAVAGQHENKLLAATHVHISFTLTHTVTLSGSLISFMYMGSSVCQM